MRSAALAILVTCGALGACSSPPVSPPATEEVKPLPPKAWFTRIVRDPQLFVALMATTSRDGWIALHNYDFKGAIAHFKPNNATSIRARGRATRDLWLLYADLDRVASLVQNQRFAGEAANTSPLTTLAVEIAQHCGDFAHPAWNTFRTSERRAAHLRALQGDLQSFESLAQEPLMVEYQEDFNRVFFDPCVARTLEAYWESQTVTLSEHFQQNEASLELTLFGPVLEWDGSLDAFSGSTASAEAAENSGDPLASSTPVSVEQQLKTARTQAEQIDSTVGSWQAELKAAAGPQGSALLTDLALLDRFRHETLTVAARHLLQLEHPHGAVFLLQHGKDTTTEPISPTNSPHALALSAEAALKTGRARQALDALQPLASAYPELSGLKELTADLAIAQGLDRQGDSKEL